MNQSEMIDFFVIWKNHPKERMVEMINIIKQKIEVDIELKKRINFICKFCNTIPTFINGSIRNIDKTNINYVEPHKVIIKGISFLIFNYSQDIYIKNLSNKIKLSELENYIRNIN